LVLGLFRLCDVVLDFAFLQSGIAVSDELLALYEQVKLRKAHKYIIFSLKKTDAAGRTYDWSIDYTAPPNEDIPSNQVLLSVLRRVPR
jgi:hypothetical protein